MGESSPLGPLASAFPRGTLAILEELLRLSRLRERGAPVRTPVVTLHLRSGRDVLGTVLALEQGRNGGTQLAVLQASQDRSPPTDVTLLDASSVEAITVHGLGQLEQPLTRNGEAEPAPSRLELRRMGPALAEQLTSAVGKALKVELEVPEQATEDERRTLGQLAQRMVTVLTALAQDELGKKTLIEKVQTVALGTGEAISLGDGVLRLGVGSGIRGFQALEALQERIEAVL